LALKEKNKALTADSEALDRIAKSDRSLCITDTAKALQIRPKNLFYLMENLGSKFPFGYLVCSKVNHTTRYTPALK
ncbi:MAG: phage antirepressor KilAC domain-containing protein, partial [Betaproteobacteria bacterium]|nr:phage antirepressor KilAC domain-containing protein [Betaproteobacteria bacterium]